MQKFKARWAALLAATVLLLSFALSACVGEPEQYGALLNVYIVKSGLQTTYFVGDTFDYSDVKLRAVYENGEQTLFGISKGVEHNELDMSKSGTQELTLTYKEKSASVTITIYEKNSELRGLQFAGGVTAYTVGAEIDYSLFKLSAVYSLGEDIPLDGTSEGVEHNEISTAEPGSFDLTFTYTDTYTNEEGTVATVTVPVTVAEELPVSPVAVSLEVQSKAADRAVSFNATVDYSKFTLVQHYSNGTTNTAKGDDVGVTHNEIDTRYIGEQELIFSLGGMTAVPVTVVVLSDTAKLNSFALPKFYADAMAVKDDPAGTASTARDAFMKGITTYKVGDDNAFEFQPEATVLAPGFEQVTVTARTTFTVEKKGEDGEFAAVDAATYVETDPARPNFYNFTEEALGGVFRFTIKPDAAYSISEGVAQEIVAVFEVVDGYNVYDQIGLSVFDNLNVKHWKDIKEAAGTLRWDSKPLVEYNTITGENQAPVAKIVLHSDITLDPDQLPDSYFWSESDDDYQTVQTILQTNTNIPESVANHLNGSLKDGFNKDNWYKFDDATAGELEEDVKVSVNMQKALYVSTGTGIEGNFHQLTYKTSGSKHSLYTVYDGKSATGSAFPLSHWSIFKYGDEAKSTAQGAVVVNDGRPVISNLRILGQSPRVASTNGEPAHLMAVNTCTNELSLENSIVSQLFVVVLGDEASSNVNVADCKLFDIYSNMFYLWRAKIDVKTSIMEDAGGPIFILCDGDRKKKDWSSDDSLGGQLVTDEESRFKSEAAGQESWYMLNGADKLFGAIKSMNQLTIGYLGISYLTQKDNIELANIVALILPEPSSIMSPASDDNDIIKPCGSVTRGEETFCMNSTGNKDLDSLFTTFKSAGAPFFQSGTKEGNCLAAMYGGSLLGFKGLNPSTDLKTAWQPAYAAGSDHWLMLLLNAGGQLDQANASKYPYFAIILGGVTAV